MDSTLGWVTNAEDLEVVVWIVLGLVLDDALFWNDAFSVNTLIALLLDFDQVELFFWLNNIMRSPDLVFKFNNLLPRLNEELFEAKSNQDHSNNSKSNSYNDDSLSVLLWLHSFDGDDLGVWDCRVHHDGLSLNHCLVLKLNCDGILLVGHGGLGHDLGVWFEHIGIVLVILVVNWSTDSHWYIFIAVFNLSLGHICQHWGSKVNRS